MIQTKILRGYYTISERASLREDPGDGDHVDLFYNSIIMEL